LTHGSYFTLRKRFENNGNYPNPDKPKEFYRDAREDREEKF